MKSDIEDIAFVVVRIFVVFVKRENKKLYFGYS